MSKSRFRVSIEDWTEIHQLPDSWPPAQLRKVLELADFDDVVGDEDLAEMTLMALQDLGPRDATELVLQLVFGDAMSPGVRQNLVDDLEDDRPWEQFASVEQQAGIFETVVLLQRAFPNRFGIPDAVRLRLRVEATDAETSEWLSAGTSSALLLRVLAGGMPEDAVLRRLYSAELQSEEFPAADAILWQIHETGNPRDAEPASRVVEVYSSWQWLGPLEDHEPWTAAGWPDG